MGCRRAAGGHRGPRQEVASRLGGTADKVSKEGTPERSAAREPGAMSSPWSSCMKTPCPAPARLDASAEQVRFRHDHRRGALTALLHHRRDGDPGDRFFGLAAVNPHAGSRLVSWRPEGTLPAATPQEVAMSPLLLIIFIPLFVGGVAFVALLFAAATAGSGDAFEQRPQEGTTAAEEVLSRGAPSEPSSARAA